MNKVILSIFIIVSLKDNFIQAMDYYLVHRENMENKKDTEVKTNSISPKEFIVAGVSAGGSIEFVNFVRKEGRYKHIFQMGKKYPGFFIAGFSATFGTALLYGQTIKSFFTFNRSSKN